MRHRSRSPIEAPVPKSHAEEQEEELTKLAAAVREALDMDAVYAILGLPNPAHANDR